jgi:REP element-mobilizing transposase RayT
VRHEIGDRGWRRTPSRFFRASCINFETSAWGDVMARLGRYFLPDQPLHVIQRGNSRQAIFFGDADYARFRTFLVEATHAYGCAIHAYVLMTNHIHLLITPVRQTSVPRMMQSLGRRYVRRINDVYQRSGTLWEGRYRAAPIDSEILFPCLLPLHRAQSGACADERDAGRLSVVELSGQRSRDSRSAHPQA